MLYHRTSWIPPISVLVVAILFSYAWAAATLGIAFSPTAIVPSTGTSTLTYSLGNTAGSGSITLSSAFTHNFPAGQTLANTTVTTGSCAGIQDNTGGTLSVGDTGIRIPNSYSIPSTDCVITVQVTVSAAGSYANTTPSLVTSGGTAAAASATLTGLSTPTLGIAFSPASIAPNTGTSVLTYSLGNPNSTAITLSSAFSHTFPTNQTIKNTTVGGTCTGLTLQDASGGTLGAGDTGIRIPNSYSIPAGGCTVTVNVGVSAVGSYTNTTPVLATSTGSSATASATLSALAAPTLDIAFSPSTIAMLSPDVSVLTYTFGNPNASAITLSSIFTHSFPSKQVLSSGAVGGTCPNIVSSILDSGGNSLGTDDTGIRLPVGFSIPAGGCTVVVNVKVNGAGNFVNNPPAFTTASGNSNSPTATLVGEATTSCNASEIFGVDYVNISSQYKVNLSTGSLTP